MSLSRKDSVADHFEQTWQNVNVGNFCFFCRWSKRGFLLGFFRSDKVATAISFLQSTSRPSSRARRHGSFERHSLRGWPPCSSRQSCHGSLQGSGHWAWGHIFYSTKTPFCNKFYPETPHSNDSGGATYCYINWSCFDTLGARCSRHSSWGMLFTPLTGAFKVCLEERCYHQHHAAPGPSQVFVVSHVEHNTMVCLHLLLILHDFGVKFV